MFELSVACKYLIPRRRQISVSIISLISILVIALVVWLIVVFFSVTDGLEKNWVNKLTSLTAPVRISPTDAYFNSYYYQIDSISDESGYSHKTIGEKLTTEKTDPYDPEFDQEVPSFWPPPDKNSDGSMRDLVKGVYDTIAEIKGISGITGQDYELTSSHIRLKLYRPAPVFHAQNIFGSSTQSYLSYPSFLGNFESDNRNLDKILLPITAKDVNNVFSLMDFHEDPNKEDEKSITKFNSTVYHKRLESFFHSVTITGLKSRSSGWNIPYNLLPNEFEWDGIAILKNQTVKRVIVPVSSAHLGKIKQQLEDQALDVMIGKISIKNSELFFNGSKVNLFLPITLEGDTPLNAQLVESSIQSARRNIDVKFTVEFNIQGNIIKGIVPFKGIDLGSFSMSKNQDENVYWIAQKNGSYILPSDPDIGDGVLLPKSFLSAGVLVGDRGRLSYLAPTTTTLQEHYLPIYVAGFYDPGIIPIGGKFILANQSVSSLIRSSHQSDDRSTLTNGINVRFDDITQADEVKKQLIQGMKARGISRYWNVETYREFEFTKAIIQELQSQKNIFMLIAVVIIIVACSNIISMLIILVNDKKTEIGILRSMGATTKSIAFIFGIAGAIIGITGSLMGIAAALLTLQNMGFLIGLLSSLQGHEVFNAMFYGEVLPHELSYEALTFVLCATAIISLLAGIVPAIKACLLRPAQIFNSGGS